MNPQLQTGSAAVEDDCGLERNGIVVVTNGNDHWHLLAGVSRPGHLLHFLQMSPLVLPALSAGRSWNFKLVCVELTEPAWQVKTRKRRLAAGLILLAPERPLWLSVV